MIYATKIRMKPNCNYSDNLLEIDMIYLTGEVKQEGWYQKEVIHDFIKDKGGQVKVNISPYPLLQPMVSPKGEKYVRSTPNSSGRDNLLALPRG